MIELLAHRDAGCGAILADDPKLADEADQRVRTDTATTRRFRLNGPSRISTAFCVVGASYLVTETFGRKFSTLDAYVNEPLAILASAEHGAKADTGSHAGNSNG